MDSVAGDDRGLDDRPDVLALFASLRDALPKLEALLDDCSGHWGYEDLIYRLYHQSFKVYGAQRQTLAIVDALQALAPTRPLNKDFMTIVRAGTGHVFEREHNQRWLEVTRPIIEAFLHARFFLEMAVLYGQVIDRPLTRLPSGWAAFLYLYNLR